MTHEAGDATTGPQVLRELTPEGVLVATLNRPEAMNAIIPELETELMQILIDAEGDDRAKVIVLTGAGRGFCAGADMKYLARLSSGEQKRPPKLRRYHYFTEYPKPIIAAINGACVGGGFVLAMMCDMRFASATAKVGATFSRLGLPAENGLAWVLPRVMGYARAFEVLASGASFSSDDLLRLGIVNAVYPPEDLMRETLRFATDLARNCSPRSMAIAKAQLRAAITSDVAEADRLSGVLVDACLASGDVPEALRARKEGRAPNFTPLGKNRAAWWPGS